MIIYSDERFSLTNTMTGYEKSMRSQLDDAEEKIAEDLQKASDIYTGSIDDDFQMKQGENFKIVSPTYRNS